MMNPVQNAGYYMPQSQSPIPRTANSGFSSGSPSFGQQPAQPQVPFGGANLGDPNALISQGTSTM